MARQFEVPASPTVYKQVYAGFNGCDFTSDASMVSDRRFPDALNLTLDVNGYPEKRAGFRKRRTAYGEVKKMFRGVLQGKVFFFIWEGSALVVLDADFNQLQMLTNVINCFFCNHADGIYVFIHHSSASAVYLACVENNSFFMLNKTDEAFVPTTSVAGHVLTDDNLDPNIAPSAGGATLEDVNLLTRKRINTFKIEAGYTEQTDTDLALNKPMYLFLDGDLAMSAECKQQLQELYLRAFCVDPSAGASQIDKNEIYTDAWDAVYGTENGFTEYCAWVERIGSHGQRAGEYSFEGNHAKYLMRFVDNHPLLKRVLDSGSYGFGIDADFKVEIYKQGVGYAELPMYAYREEYSHGGSAKTPRFDFYCVLSEVLVDGYYTAALSDRRIGVYRLRHYKTTRGGDVRSYAPDTTLADNVKVHFTANADKEQDSVNKVFTAKCTAMYGVLGTADRIFLSGAEGEAHYIRYSAMDNPLYFPDLNYIVCGNANTSVISMFPINGALVAAKEPNGQDVNLFLISGNMSEGEALFSVQSGVPGTGVVSDKAVCFVDDLPHFLSDNGVLTMTGSAVQYKQILVNRSFLADPLLTKENLQNACMTFFEGQLYVAFADSGSCYVFNTKDKTYLTAAGDTHYIYECWRWSNIHATCFLKDGDCLMFGTADGIYQFNFDIDGPERYNDDGAPILARFVTKSFSDGSFLTLKSMRKRGSGIIVKPYVRGSCDVAVITDSTCMDLKKATADIFTWEYLDFLRIDFSTNDAIRIIPFNQKVKKYATLQFVVKNEQLNESFGVIGIEKAYTVGNYKKN